MSGIYLWHPHSCTIHSRMKKSKENSIRQQSEGEKEQNSILRTAILSAAVAPLLCKENENACLKSQPLVNSNITIIILSNTCFRGGSGWPDRAHIRWWKQVTIKWFWGSSNSTTFTHFNGLLRNRLKTFTLICLSIFVVYGINGFKRDYRGI